MTLYMIEEEDEIKLSERFRPYLQKLYNFCNKNDISTSFGQQNVRFFKENKTFSISYTYLYRQSGIKSIHREKTENLIEIIDITDDMFYENYVKATISLFFSK